MTPPKKLRSALITEGLDRAPHRAFLRATGVDEADFGKPFIGIVSQHGENTPCSMSLGPQADAARLGVAAGDAIPGAVHDHLGVRRRLDEPQGHADEPGLARADRRFDRGGDARPCLRRAGRLRRLRQDTARRDDGDGAPELPERLRLRRRDAAGPLEGSRRHDPDDLRERRDRSSPAA
jgi:hypothetical protein